MARERRPEKRDPDPGRGRKKDDDDRKKDKGKGKKKSGTPAQPGTITEQLKAKSTQSGDQAMNAVPNSYPAEPANAEAVYTTGPGQAVEYNYTRQGTYADQYAEQQSQVVTVQGNPVAGPGQIVTSGAANNPT
jgi:hypothetical protein